MDKDWYKLFSKTIRRRALEQESLMSIWSCSIGYESFKYKWIMLDETPELFKMRMGMQYRRVIK